MKTGLLRVLGLFLLLALLHVATPIHAAGVTRFVAPNGVDQFNGFCMQKHHPCQTFAFALVLALPGDTIRGAAGDYPGEQLDIFKDITIVGVARDDTRINGAGNVRVVFVHKGVTVTLAHLSLLNGLGSDGGGAIRNEGTLTLNDTYLWGNSAFLGGGAINNGGTLTIQSSLIALNTSIESNSGGGIDNSGKLVMSQSTIFENNARWGGGLANETGGTATLTDCTIGSNTARTWGGGIAVFGGKVTLKRVTLSVNTANDIGGGIYNAGTALLTDVTLDNNEATFRNGAGNGGGIANVGSLTLSRVTFDSNQATGRGGALYNNADGADAVLTNVTFYNNQAQLGSGIMSGYDTVASTALKNVTLFSDSVVGNGIYMNYGEVTVKNSIIGDGSSFACFGQITSLGHNIGDPGCGLHHSKHDLIGVDPKVGAFGDWGGFTNTYRLTASSPAIDAGTNTGCPSTDQRGVARPVDGDGDGSKICDIGAFEYRPAQ